MWLSTAGSNKHVINSQLIRCLSSQEHIHMYGGQQIGVEILIIVNIICTTVLLYPYNPFLVCSISGVSTETKQVSFGGQTQFQCDLGGNGRLWWQSRDCNPGSFVRSDRTDCRDGDLMCVVPVEVYQDGYFYFCCTPMDARSVAEASPLQCFQVQGERCVFNILSDYLSSSLIFTF